MRIRLLGEFTVDRDGTPVRAREWRLRKARTLVKLLALAPDQRMHRDVLLELLWPGRPAPSAANNLHQALHVARRVLAGEETHDGLLELHDDVVVLRAGSLVDVDVRRFERLAADARAGGGLADLRAAVAAYAGDLLPEDRFEDWAAGRREELRQLLCELLVELGARAGSRSFEAEALAALQRALAIDPRHEGAARGLMRRLAAAGRRPEALARYEKLRDDLRAEYGSDPDPATRRLYRELLTGDGGEEQPSRPAPARHNLAPPLTSFVGRDREIADVHRLLSRGGLLTLTGVGGAGKTRLAEEAARRLLGSFPDGVWFADLAGVGDPRRVADAVASALGLEPAAGPDPLRTLAARLAPRTLLLILDNCEHLLAACADVAGAIRRTCPGVALLATSREPLHAPGEVTFRVPSLKVPGPEDGDDPDRLAMLPSVRLFLDRSRDVRPGFVLDAGNAAAIVEICRRLDGIPLALELAAARMSHLEAVEIAERLHEALSLLGPRGRLTRHATLRAALEWSHALLARDEQILLRRLAVFAGSFSLPSAEQVCADKLLPRPEILDCLGRIADKSLVQIERAGDRSRYRLLETIRQLARERLTEAGEADAFDAAHCRHFVELAIDNDPDRASGIVVERPQLLDIDHDNLRAALGWAVRHDPGQALLLGVSLWRYWLARGHFVEGSGWLERILTIAPGSSPERARALFALAVLDARRGLSDRLPRLGAEAVAAAERSGPPADVTWARLMRGILLVGVGEIEEVERIAQAALADGGGRPAAPVVATAQWLAALAALFREDVRTAGRRFATCLRRLSVVDPAVAPFLPAVTLCMPLVPVGDALVPVFEESWLLGRRVGAVQGQAYALSALGYVHRLAGDLGAALRTVDRSVAAFARIDDLAGLAHALNHLGCVERDARLFDAAERHLQEALRLRERLGDRRGENLSLANLGLLSAAVGDIAKGRRLARTALDRGEAVDDGPGVGGALLNLAVVELFGGARDRARVLVEQAVEAFEPQGYLRLVAWARLLAAELALDDGDRAALERHGRAADDVFRRLHSRIGISRVEALPLSDAKPVRRSDS
ncbi:BTAD domain-containing putative transcriptional regulator [Actinoplanes sp. NPDC049681]|uniref:BTAD domain-containing putative transcriptional regulator n=1 Tax=Actinoplanes sp. NPDC049681 TaxID=3363905 RepID=UPI0037A0F6A5